MTSLHNKATYAVVAFLALLLPVCSLYFTSLILEHWLAATGNKVILAYLLTMTSEFLIGLVLCGVVVGITFVVGYLSQLKRNATRTRNQPKHY